MKRNFMSLAAAFALSLLVTGAVTLADDATDYGIFIGDTEITSVNASDVFGDGTVSFDAATYTLTLNGAELSADDCAGISNESAQNLTISVTGDSSIEVTEDDGIYSDGPLTITGPGVLTITADYNAVSVCSSVIIQEADLAADTGNYGIYLYDGASITITDSVLDIASEWDSIYGSNEENDVDLLITDSELTLSSASYDGCALYSEGSITIADSSLVIDKSEAMGITAFGNINITGSDLTVSCLGMGILANNTLTIKDSALNISADIIFDYIAFGILAYDIELTDSYVKAAASDSTMSAAIAAYNSFTINDPCIIYSPGNAELSVVSITDIEELYTVVLSEDGSVCLDVIIAAAYEITFADEDGTVLETGTWLYNETPEYTGDTPTKAEDDTYTYTFTGWDKEISPVTGEEIYTAVYEAEEKETKEDTEEDTEDASEDTADTAESDSAASADESPKTGDSLNPVFLAAAALLAAAAGALTLKRRDW